MLRFILESLVKTRLFVCERNYMLTIEKINELIGVEESFHASYKLIELLSNEDDKNQLFDKFLNEEQDLSFDWFTEYFQAEHSDRKGKKQDFTPDGIIRVASGVLGDTKTNADICAGTGGLTIKRYSENKEAEFYCEEFSDRAMPFLLFNLAIRNLNAVVCHGDSLTRTFKKIYKLTKTEKFSTIGEISDIPKFEAGTVIMNPPYSLPWSGDKKLIEEDRFKEFGAVAPKSKADFAFLLQGVYQLSETGTMSIILPHGVLFRGNTEGTIRENILRNNLLDAIIGLPGKAFMNTDILTVLLVLKKNRDRKDVLFIDASKEFKKAKANNILEDDNVNKILDTFWNRKEIDKFSRKVYLEELKENDFNLNIPRYIDTFEPEEVPEFSQIMQEMAEIDSQIIQAEQELSVMLSELVGTTPEADRQIKEFAEFYKNRINPRKNVKRKHTDVLEGQLSLL